MHTLCLSLLFTDPALKAAFARAERDLGDDFAVPAVAPKPRPTLSAEAKVEACELECA